MPFTDRSIIHPHRGLWHPGPPRPNRLPDRSAGALPYTGSAHGVHLHRLFGLGGTGCAVPGALCGMARGHEGGGPRDGRPRQAVPRLYAGAGTGYPGTGHPRRCYHPQPDRSSAAAGRGAEYGSPFAGAGPQPAGTAFGPGTGGSGYYRGSAYHRGICQPVL